ncbi:oligopeptide/dipeptide ABC transporter ATP-binding protein [Yinghuangia aomiensis]
MPPRDRDVRRADRRTGARRTDVRPAHAPVHGRLDGREPAPRDTRRTPAAIPGTVPAPHDWPQGCRFAARCPIATDTCGTGPVHLGDPVPGRRTRCIHARHLLPEGATT